MIKLTISAAVRTKLKDKHRVQELEIEECFLEEHGGYLIDNREDHTTDPQTLWFIGKTYRGRLLKIVFASSNGNIYIKTAYEPNVEEIRMYEKSSNK